MKARKWLRNTIIILLIIAAGWFYWQFYFVFATGTKAGVLNTFQHKGVIFKTWEGKIIQSGFKANVQSNEFSFSVTNPKVAAILEQNSGRDMNLHYKLYMGALPWRGMQKFIVDSVIEIRGNGGVGTIESQ
ncbi:hypothetical protein [Hydrotalea sp.]|uniref:hypothetical protein n=1 Tax=Hydrotalea sp. TaxID=2881279 RepID=UPI003D10A810